MLYVHGIDLNDNLEFECNKENLLISTIGKFIDELENEFCSKELLNINIDFKNGNQLYYNTGELSVFFQEADDLENFVISFLKLYNFKNTDLLDKLRGFENEYLYIYPESEFDFNRFKFLLDDRLTDEPPF
jgi:capsule polysaccharide modification protein KpsS